MIDGTILKIPFMEKNGEVLDELTKRLSEPDVQSFLDAELKSRSLGYLDYNDNYDSYGFSYPQISEEILQKPFEDSYDFSYEEGEIIRNALEALQSKFPEFSDLKPSVESEFVINSLSEEVLSRVKYENVKTAIAKKTRSKWFKIECPYFRETLRACETAANGWNEKSQYERFEMVVTGCFMKMGLSDYEAFAKEAVKNMASYLNLDYQELWSDYPLAFYTKIEIADLLDIARNPGKVYELKLEKDAEFGITDDGGATESIGRSDVVIPVTFFEGESFLTVIDGSEKLVGNDRKYSATGAYLSDFYGDKLCGLVQNACGTVIVSETSRTV